MAGNTIPKGFVLKARKIEDSDIAHASPCTRELWDLILRKANFRDQKCGRTVIKRGQWLTSYEEIQDLLHWRIGFRKLTYSWHQIEAATKYMRSRSMVTTAKATRGFFITVVNYEKYQRLDSYERHTESHDEDHDNATGQRRNGKNVKNYGPNSDEFRLAGLLFELIQERKPDFKQPDLQKWAVHIGLMIRKDGRTPERIEAVIRRCQADGTPRGTGGFCWANNILSTEKLREQFDKLELWMKPQPQRNEPPADAPVPLERGPNGLTPREQILRQGQHAREGSQ